PPTRVADPAIGYDDVEPRPNGPPGRLLMCRLFAVGVVALLTGTAVAAPPGPGYHAKINVSAPTRLDWTVVLSNHRVETAPGDWLPGDYDSTKQSYELFVPEKADVKKPLPLVLFISPGDQAVGFKQFEGPCKDLGMLFVGVHGAGNNCPMKKRV